MMDNNYVAETPNLAKEWCPSCEPERDPSREILQVHHCYMHDPGLLGSADAMVTPPEHSAWSTPGEAGGDESRRINDLLRGEFWSNR